MVALEDYRNHFAGGTFALYSLICRYVKVSLIPNQQAEDCNVSTYKLELLNRHVQRASWLKSKLEKSNLAKILLLFGSVLGTSMVIGDGVLTPCISGSHENSLLVLVHYYLSGCNSATHVVVITGFLPVLGGHISISTVFHLKLCFQFSTYTCFLVFDGSSIGCRGSQRSNIRNDRR